MARSKLNIMTQTVLDARAMYVKNLRGVLNDYASTPYMKKPVSRETADRQLLAMTPDQMSQLSQTDPRAAEQAAYRISQLEQKNPTPLPAQDDYQP